MEILELRLLSSLGLTPNLQERAFVAALNVARADPVAYGRTIQLDLSDYRASPQLVTNPRLTEAARRHAEDMLARGYFAHDTPEGKSPGDRIAETGYETRLWAESLMRGFGRPDADDALRWLVWDYGVPDLGHRRHLLAYDEHLKLLTRVGVGFATDGVRFYWAVETAMPDEKEDRLPWVAQVHRDVLGRNPSDAEAELWAVRPDLDVVIGLLRSPERYRMAVDAVYHKLLRRAPEGEGRAKWTSLLENILSYEQFQAIVASSDEYWEKSRKDYRRYVTRLYQDFLDRAPADFEVDIWVGLAERDRYAAAVGIVRSYEARVLDVHHVYRKFLGRPADPFGLDVFVKHSSTGVIAAILLSHEYRKKAGW